MELLRDIIFLSSFFLCVACQVIDMSGNHEASPVTDFVYAAAIGWRSLFCFSAIFSVFCLLNFPYRFMLTQAFNTCLGFLWR